MTQCLENQLIMEIGALPTADTTWSRLIERFEQLYGARAAHLYQEAWTIKHNVTPYLSTSVATSYVGMSYTP